MRHVLLQEPDREVWLVREGEVATLGVREVREVAFACPRSLLLTVGTGVEVQLSNGSDYVLLRKRSEGLAIDFSVGGSGRRSRSIDESVFRRLLEDA